MTRPRWLKGYMALGAGGLVILSVAVLIGASATPARLKKDTTLVNYTQSGRFSYTTYLKPSYLYGPTPEPAPSNPQYPLAAVGNINFSYDFNPSQAGWSGSASVQAVLENPGIWKKTVVLVPASAVAGAFSLHFTLNLGQMNDLFDQIEKETSISASPRTISLAASLESGGGGALQTLPMKLDKDVIEISSDLGSKLPSGTGRFDYTVNRKAADVPDAVYPIELVSGLSFGFNFASGDSDSSGLTGKIEEVLENPGIWQKSLVLVPATLGAGSLSLRSGFDLATVQKQFDDIDAQTKIAASPRVVTLKATVVSGNETFVQELRLTIDRELLQVPGNLTLTLPAGRGKFDYSVNLKPNTLFDSTVLQPSQSASSGVGGTPGYEINLTPPAPQLATGATTLATGQSAFIKLVDRMDVTFSYDFKSDQPVTGQSTDVQVVATLEAPQAWSKELPLLHATRSGSFNLSLPLDIAGYSELLDAIRNETGVSPDAINISVVARLHTTGQTSFGPIDQNFSPSLKGTIKGNVLQWDKELAWTQPGAITRAAKTTGGGTFLGMTSGAARGLSAGLMVVFILTLGLLVFLYLQPAHVVTDPVEREVLQIRKKYNLRVVEGTGGTSPWGNNVVAVASFQDLIKVADELAKPVVHQGPADRFSPHTYYIMDGNTRYQYRIESEIGAPPVAPEKEQP